MRKLHPWENKTGIHHREEMEGGQDLFITFSVDAKSSERPCSAEQRSTLNGLEVSEQTFLPLSHSPFRARAGLRQFCSFFFFLNPLQISAVSLVPCCCLANHTWGENRVEREHGDGDDDSVWYPSVIFVHTILHYPGVSDSRAPFCGPLQRKRKRKVVLKRSCGAAEYASKNERTEGGRNGWASGHLWFTIKNCHPYWPLGCT